MEKLIRKLKKLRLSISEKRITRKIIYNYIALFDKNADLEIIKTYFDLKRGYLNLDDFISILMLLHHHKHIDLKIGFYLETNSFYKALIHNLFLSNLEIKKSLSLKKRNRNFHLSTNNYTQKTKDFFNLRVRVDYKKSELKDFEISFMTKNSGVNFAQIQSRSKNFLISKDKDLIKINIIKKDIDCYFFDSLIQLDDFCFDFNFKGSQGFFGLLNTKENKNKEFLVEIKNIGWDMNFEYIFSTFFEDFSHSDNLLISVLKQNFNGKILIQGDKKNKLIGEIFAEDKNSQLNGISHLFFYFIVYIFEYKQNEIDFFFDVLKNNLLDVLTISIKFYGIEINLNIEDLAINEILDYFEAKLIKYFVHLNQTSKEVFELENKIDYNLKITELENFKKSFQNVEDNFMHNLEKKYSSERKDSQKTIEKEIQSNREIYYFLNNSKIKNSHTIDNLFNKTGQKNYHLQIHKQDKTDFEKTQPEDDLQKNRTKKIKNGISDNNQIDTKVIIKQSKSHFSDGVDKQFQNNEQTGKNLKKIIETPKDNVIKQELQNKKIHKYEKIDKTSEFNIDNKKENLIQNKNKENVKKEKKIETFRDEFNKNKDNEIDKVKDNNLLINNTPKMLEKQDLNGINERIETGNIIESSKNNLLFELNSDYKIKIAKAQMIVMFKEILRVKKKIKFEKLRKVKVLKLQSFFFVIKNFLTLFKKIRQKRRQTFKNELIDEINKPKKFSINISFAKTSITKLKTVVFVLNAFLKLLKHVRKNNYLKKHEGYLEKFSCNHKKALILKRNTLIFSIKVFLNLYSHVKLRKLNIRKNTFLGLKEKLYFQKTLKFRTIAFSLKTFLNLYKHVQRLKITKKIISFIYPEKYLLRRKFVIISKCSMAFFNLLKTVRNKKNIMLNLKFKRAFLKVKCFLVFKNFILFNLRKKTKNISLKFSQNLKFKLISRIYSVTVFLQLFKFVKNNKITQQHKTFFFKKESLLESKIIVLKKKVYSISKFIYLLKFVRNRNITRKNKSLSTKNYARGLKNIEPIPEENHADKLIISKLIINDRSSLKSNKNKNQLLIFENRQMSFKNNYNDNTLFVSNMDRNIIGDSMGFVTLTDTQKENILTEDEFEYNSNQIQNQKNLKNFKNFTLHNKDNSSERKSSGVRQSRLISIKNENTNTKLKLKYLFKSIIVLNSLFKFVKNKKYTKSKKNFLNKMTIFKKKKKNLKAIFISFKILLSLYKFIKIKRNQKHKKSFCEELTKENKKISKIKRLNKDGDIKGFINIYKITKNTNFINKRKTKYKLKTIFFSIHTLIDLLKKVRNITESSDLFHHPDEPNFKKIVFHFDSNKTINSSSLHYEVNTIDEEFELKKYKVNFQKPSKNFLDKKMEFYNYNHSSHFPNSQKLISYEINLHKKANNEEFQESSLSFKDMNDYSIEKTSKRKNTILIDSESEILEGKKFTNPIRIESEKFNKINFFKNEINNSDQIIKNDYSETWEDNEEPEHQEEEDIEEGENQGTVESGSENKKFKKLYTFTNFNINYHLSEQDVELKQKSLIDDKEELIHVEKDAANLKFLSLTQKFLENSLKEIKNNLKDSKDINAYIIYCLGKFSINNNEKLIDYYFKEKMAKNKNQKTRTMTMNLNSQNFNYINLLEETQEFKVPELYLNDVDFDFSDEKEKIKKIQEFRKSFNQKPKNNSVVKNALPHLKKIDFMIDNLRFFKIDNLIKKAEKIEIDLKKKNIEEKKKILKRHIVFNKRKTSIFTKLDYYIQKVEVCQKEIKYLENSDSLESESFNIFSVNYSKTDVSKMKLKNQINEYSEIKTESHKKQIRNKFEHDDSEDNENQHKNSFIGMKSKNQFQGSSKSNEERIFLKDTNNYIRSNISDNSYVCIKNVPYFQKNLMIKDYGRLNYSKQLNIGRNFGSNK